MITCFYDFAIIDYDNLIGIFDCTESVSYNYYGFTFVKFIQIFNNYLFIICINAFVASSRNIYSGFL